MAAKRPKKPAPKKSKKQPPEAKAPLTDLTVEMWPIDRPIPYEKNARRLSDRAVEVLARSIRAFGFRQPIVVDEHDVIIAGHTRQRAAKFLEYTQVPVHVATGLTPEQVRAYRLADNRTADETSWDIEVLENELAELEAMNVDLDLTAFTEDELREYMKPDPKTDEDAAPELPAAPVSAAGDMWLLGSHRVLCGDSTDTDATERIVGEHKADLVFTDPPYNVDYEGYTEEKLKIESDHMSPEQFCAFLRETFASYAATVKPEASLYVCHPSSYQREFQDALEAAGFSVRCQIIWAKNTFAWGFGRYKFQHEPIFYCHKAAVSDAWYGDKSQSTLWEEKKPAANRLHPTMKPVELIERALANSSKPHDIVLDLFGGSGSTLIACEKNARAARLMELDPRYVDVIVTRWQEFTGQEATLDGDGRTFREIATERVHVEKEEKSGSSKK